MDEDRTWQVRESELLARIKELEEKWRGMYNLACEVRDKEIKELEGELAGAHFCIRSDQAIIKDMEAMFFCGHEGCEDELIVTCHTHIGEDYPCARFDGKDAPPEDPISPPDPLVQHDDPISPREAF